jgi:hypothetical protein
MADIESIADKACEYVFGELPPEQREEFEAMLDQSPELRAHVRELEEGAVAIAAACPNALPPKSAWREINRTITHEQKRKRIQNIVAAIFRNGWAAAAACIIGWLIFALAPERSPSSSTSKNSVASRPSDGGSIGAVNASSISGPDQIALTSTPTNQLSSEAVHRDTTNLRNQLAGLQQQIAQLSSALTQHQAALNEPSRLKFFQLTPSTGVEKSVLSPAVQRAFFYALAQELGWLSFTNSEGNPNFHFAPDDPAASGTNAVNMDFVDLRTPTNSAPPVRLRVPASKELAVNTDASATQDAKSTVIPAFVSGTSVFLAVDSSMGQPDTQMLVSAGLGQNQEVFGTVTLADAPVIIAVRGWQSAAEGVPLTLTFFRTDGTSNFVYSVFTPPLNP